MATFTEQNIQKIAADVYRTLGTRFGVGQVPTHIHDNTDAPNIPPTSLTNVVTLSTVNGGVLENISVSNMVSPVTVFPIPVLTAPPTGTAPEGTLLAVTGAVSPGLYVRAGSAWIRVGPTP